MPATSSPLGRIYDWPTTAKWTHRQAGQHGGVDEFGGLKPREVDRLNVDVRGARVDERANRCNTVGS
jgi:hypothetical protein